MQWAERLPQQETHLGQRARLGVVFDPLQRDAPIAYRGAESFPAASVIKVPMMLAVLQEVEAGRLSLDETMAVKAEDMVGGAGVLMEMHAGLVVTLRDLVHLMIVVSDNTASNLLMDRLGRDVHNAAFDRMGLGGTRLGRRFMHDPDSPRHQNLTTPEDMSRCLRRLFEGEYLGPAGTQQAIDILTRQQYREKIPLLLPEGLRIGHKTGENAGVRHDVALVLTPHPYVLVCLTSEVDDVLLADRTIADLSRAVFQQHDPS